jgi:cytosine/adenosine deaminase-related metal-dependent hydrolase
MAQKSPLKIFIAQHVLPIEGEILSPGALVIQGDKILEVGASEEMKGKYPDALIERFEGKTLLPGLVNAHADLSLTDYSKYPHEPFETKDGNLLVTRWLINVSRFKASLTIPDQKNAILRGLELTLRSGVTTCGDVCRYPVAQSLYEDSGLRVVCLAEVENIQRNLAQEDFEQALALVDEIQHGENPRITAGLAPLSAYTLSKNLLRILANHAVQQEIPLHLQAALHFSEMEFFYDSLGEISAVLFKEAGWEDKIPPAHRMTPIQYLHEIGILKAKPSILGCLHLGPTDNAILNHAGCTRIYAPMAFQFLKVGELPWGKIFQDKVPWSLGTLGKASGSSLNLWDEMRMILYENEMGDRAQIADQILRAATLGGAKALQLEEKVGSLVKNKQADFIVVDTPSGDDSLTAGLIDQTREGSLVASFVAGERLSRRS